MKTDEWAFGKGEVTIYIVEGFAGFVGARDGEVDGASFGGGDSHIVMPFREFKYNKFAYFCSRETGRGREGSDSML